MPIVVVKSGRSAAGERATSSHTGALLAASDVTVDALFEQAGVIRTESLAELLDVAALLENQPLPGGSAGRDRHQRRRARDHVRGRLRGGGLEVPELPEDVRDRLAELLPAEAGLLNPVDMIATATAEHYRGTIRALADWDGIDALIVIFIRPLLTRAEDVATAIREAVEEMPREIPVQAVFMSPQDHAAISGGGVPTHLYPEDAARTLARVMRHVDWRDRAAEEAPDFEDVRRGRGGGTDRRRARVRAANGCRWNRRRDCSTATESRSRPGGWPPILKRPAEAADELGGRVALKAQGPGLVHKTEMGAVRIGLAGGAEVTRAAEEMDEAIARAEAQRESFIVQAMVEGGRRATGRRRRRPHLRPGARLRSRGHPGRAAQGRGRTDLPDHALTRLSGCSRSLATFPLLTGFRGGPEADLEAVAGAPPPRQRDGRGPSRDRRARPQSRAGRARGRDRRRLPRQGEERAASPPLARDLEVETCSEDLPVEHSTTSRWKRSEDARLPPATPGRSGASRRAQSSRAVNPQLMAELADQGVDGRLDRGREPLARLEALALDAVDGEAGGQPIQLPGKLDRVGDAERMCR